MEKERWKPENGIVEPDFLEYLVRTFDRWQKLSMEGVTLGTREIAKFQNILMGAKLNSRFGFDATVKRKIGEDGLEHYTLRIYKNRKAVKKGEHLYTFDTVIFR